MAVAAGGTVVAADQLVKSVQDEEDQDYRLVKAAISAVVAVGAYEIVKRDENKDRPDDAALTTVIYSRSHHHDDRDDYYRHHHHHRDEPALDPPRHTRHLIEEAAGAYGLGRDDWSWLDFLCGFPVFSLLSHESRKRQH